MDSTLRDRFSALCWMCAGDDLDAFLDTLTAAERDGADLSRLHDILSHAFEHRLHGQFLTTTVRPAFRRIGPKATRLNTRAGRVLRELLDLHAMFDPKGIDPELSEPYRAALHRLENDPVIQMASQKLTKVGPPQARRAQIYQAMKAAGVQTIYHRDLLRQLHIIR